MEKGGTFTNTERRVQRLQPVLPAPGEAWPDWKIIGELATRLDRALGRPRAEGYWHYPSQEAIFNELTSVTPIYRGMTYQRMAAGPLQWPCPDAGHPGTPYLHKDGFARGLGKFHNVEARGPAEPPDEEFPLILTTGRVLYHYHSGTMTRRSEPLHWREPRGFAEVHPDDAATVGLKDGYAVVIESRRGQVKTKARLSERVPPGTVFLAFHWREAPANILTQDHTLDPVAKIPEYKVSAVRLINPRAR